MTIGPGTHDEVAREIAETLDVAGVLLVVIDPVNGGVEFKTSLLVDELSLMEPLASYLAGLIVKIRSDAGTAERQGVKPS